MPCAWRTSHLQLLLVLTVFLVAAKFEKGKQKNSKYPIQEVYGKTNSIECEDLVSEKLPEYEVNISLSVMMNTKAMLFCHPVQLTTVILVTWEITLRDKPVCIRQYQRDKKETMELNCTDERITWASTPDQNSTLQIDPVAVTHDGYYSCHMVMPNGNFHYGYHLHVLVAPEVTLLRSENRTTVCKAGAGKPAAWISWTPEGNCVSEEEPWGNGTVTVQSTCHWADSNVSTVSCFVSHLAGNTSLSIQLSEEGVRTLGSPVSQLLIILYVKFSLFLIVLVIRGFIASRR